MTPTERTGRNTAKACATWSYQARALGPSARRSSSMKIASARRSSSAYSRLHLAEDAHAEAGPGNGWR
jgi:hypothetical protein